MTQEKKPSLSAQWMAFCHAPSESSFQDLYDSTSALVYTICYRILRNEEDACDAFQLTYSRLFTMAKQQGEFPESEGGAEGVVTKTAVREADALRKRRNRRARKEIVMEQLPPAAQQEGLSAHERASNNQVRERIETLVSLLPDHLRLPIMLYYFDGMSQPQIAQALDTPVSTIAARIQKGLKNLKPMMRRAGLGEAITLFAAMAGTGVFLSPPSALAASVVFAKASAAVATAGIAAGSTVSITTTATSGGFFAGAKALIISMVAVAVIGTAALILPNLPGGKEGRGLAANSSTSMTDEQNKVPGVADDQNRDSATSSTQAAEAPSLREVAFLLRWKDSGKPVAGTSLSLIIDNAGATKTAALQGKTNSKGLFHTTLPENLQRASLSVANKYAMDQVTVALSATSTTEVQVPRTGHLFGKVFDSVTGKSVAGAKVAAFDSEAETESDAEGNFVLKLDKRDRLAIYAQKGQSLSYKNTQDIEWQVAEPGKEKGPLTLALTEVPFSITGNVTSSETGDPIEGAMVSVEDKTISYRGANLSVKTDLAGGYTLPVPVARLYNVTAVAPKFALLMKNVTAKEDEPTICDFQLAKGGTVDVLAVTRDGKPVEGARVNLSIDDYTDSPQHPLTDSEGRARLTGVSLLSPGNVSAHSSEYNSCQADTPSFPAGKTHSSVKVILSKSESDSGSGKEDETKEPKAFRGLVTDETGAPLSGITVAWASYSVNPDSDKCQTGADGSYTLEVKKEQASRWTALRAFGKEYAPQWDNTVSPGTLEAPTVVDFIMKPGHWLDITVVDEAQSPIKDARLTLDVNRGRYSYYIPNINHDLKTDAEGKARVTKLPDETVMLDVSKSGLSQRADIECEVDQAVTITMKPLGVLTGRVLDAATGEAIQSMNITLSGPNVDNALRERGTDVWDKDGKFEFNKLMRDGEFEITVKAEGYTPETKAGLKSSAPDAPTEMDIHLQAAEKTKGRIVDAATGDPVAGATVIHGRGSSGHVSLQWGRMSQGGFALEDLNQTITKADGAFGFYEPTPGYYMLVSHKDFARRIITPTQRVSVKDPATGEITIALKPASAIVAVYTDGGKPKAGLKGQLNREDLYSMDFSQQFEEVTTDASGKMEWNGLEAGQYRISIGGMNREVEVKEGERKEVDMAVARGTLTLSGRVLYGTAPVPDTDVNLSRTQVRTSSWFGLVKGEPDNYPTNFSARSDKSGNYKFENLPEGKYSMSTSRHSPEDGWQHAREEFEMKADKTFDLVFAAKYKIIGQLKFPPNTPKGEEANYSSININSKKHYSFTNPEQLDNNERADIVGGKFEITGRFKGEYNATIQYSSKDRNLSIPLPVPLKLDNREGDQDLGEIDIPALGSASISGKVIDLQGNPIEGASISASPAEQNAAPSRSTNSDKNGLYRLDNLKEVSYRIYASKSVTNGKTPLQAQSQTVDVKGSTTLNFILFSNRKVTGRLTGTTPEALKILANIQSLSFKALNSEELKTDNPLNISTGASVREVPEGHFSIEGRFHGEYIINVRYRINREENIGEDNFHIPVTLDNLEGDQNIGDIPLPAFGSLVAHLDFVNTDPKQMAMTQMALLFYPSGLRSEPIIKPLDPRKASPLTITDLPVGSYDVEIYSMCHHTKQKSIRVNIKPGAAAETVAFNMIPEGAIVGNLDYKVRSENFNFTFSRVTLQGPTGGKAETRVLVPNPNLSENEAFFSGLDFTRRSMFLYRNLKPGSYAITVEAEGYEPTSIQSFVTLGQVSQAQKITMKALDSKSGN